MSLVVREADVHAERQAIVDVLVREVEGWVDDTKFDWLYARNPAGPAKCWVLTDGDEIVGVSAAFPRALRYGSRDLSTWVLGDFCVSRKLRSLGPAMMLQRPLMSAVEDEVDLWYDFPGRSMLAVYHRMGVTRTGEMTKLVYLLKADRAIDSQVKNPVAAKGLSAAGNLLLATRTALRIRQKSATLSPRKEFRGDPQDCFGLGDGVRLVHGAEYLNWKFRDDPRGGNEICVSSGGGAVVCHEGDGVLRIVDIVGVETRDALSGVVLAVVEDARARGVSSVSVVLSEGHPFASSFVELGFHRRGSSPFVVHARDGKLPESTPFYLMDGDRDL